ncbi:Rh-like protein/ammonium transporter [Amniculicola lignicola CBS 123094]|uniref:Rh-like protein/ammonium transporter n=1 Tax=Amniculicola lignicola CBS 123094 TaxID=1392246 RepID=A0A6A5X3X2_9PLEO|nr:Rh-like protein/ammonium transporter [Amniculicola lignicola CBS 123094]
MDTKEHKFDVVPQVKYDVVATNADIRTSPGKYYNAADIIWMMISSGLVFLMVPGIGLLYSGTSRKSTTYMIWMPTITTSIVGIIWFFWGYAIAFSPNGTEFWGGSTGVLFRKVDINPVGNERGPQVPELVYALFQGMFACFTASVLSGATIYKERTIKWVFFLVFWITLVYCPIAHSSWNPEGWANKWGALDFAGGTPVHICAGMSSLSYGLFYRLQLNRYNKRERGESRPEKPAKNWVPKEDKEHVPTVLVGTILLWLGWFGFNGGSALGANMRAVSAIISTHLAACAGGITGSVLENLYNRVILSNIRRKRMEKNEPPLSREERGTLRHRFFKRMVISFCNGAIAGMVAVTPASGYISPYYSPIFGVVGSLSALYALRLSKFLFDPLDIFAIHAVSGFVGMVLTAFFASADIVALDGYNRIPGGFVDHHWKQIYKQLGDSLFGMAWSFFITFFILCALNIGTWFKTSIREPRLVFDDV